MRQLKKAALFMTLSALALTSCSDESLWGGSADEGAVTLNFSTDGRVMRQTRADDTMSPVVPDGSLFKVDFTKSDNTYSKQWSSVEGFNRETAFAIGDYTLTATYGDIDVEGFENPYYKGSADVHVSPGATTEANVTATLANAMVSIRYTDAFKENFKAYSAAVQTEGHEYVMFAQTETRPAYISPCENVTVYITLTNSSGAKVTIQPATFQALARHHYVVTIGVTGNTTSGDLALDIEFDDDVIHDTVAVSLGDDLFSAPAPTITAQNFTEDTDVEKIEYEELDSNPEFHVFAFGGFKSATLTVISSSYTPLFGSSVELVNADDLTNQQLESEGIGGYFRNVDKMAVVNVKGFLEKLPSGTYTLELNATDLMTRAADPVKLTAIISPLSITLSPSSNVDFMATQVAVDLTTNSTKLANNVSFKVPNARNSMVSTDYTSVEEITASAAATRADDMHTYRYVLPVEASIRSAIDVEMIVKTGNNVTTSTVVSVNAPVYTITPDAFSNYVVLKVESGDSSIVKALIDNLKFYNGSNLISTSNIIYDESNALIIIKGLTPSVQYLSFKAVCGDFEMSIPEFTTESAEDVPNGQFTNNTETINISSINTGGPFQISFIATSTTQLKSSIVRSTPDGWANVNALTCNTASSEMNTWYVVPSTYSENGAVVIRSVGYNHNGPAISSTKTTTTYYCTNTPSQSDLNKASGELFLGSYSLDNRVDGIEWNNRPSSLSFDYSYVPATYTSEKGEVYIKILSSTGDILAEKTEYLVSSLSTISKTLYLSSYPFGEKASKIILGFKSTQSGVTPTIVIPTGSELQESQINSGNYLINTPSITVNEYKAVATGSVLTIDNVKLNYDAPSSASSANSKRRR